MECSIHQGSEAVDACRGCGKPVCPLCAEESQGRFLCARCRLASTADPSPAVRRARALPTFLSATFPGLGQAANGDWLGGVALFAVAVLLLRGVLVDQRLGVFLGILWIYQIYEAWYSAPRARGAAPPSAPGSAPVFPAAISGTGFLVAGLLLLGENLTSFVSGRMHVLLPALVIVAGLALLVSYFRTSEDAHP